MTNNGYGWTLWVYWNLGVGISTMSPFYVGCGHLFSGKHNKPIIPDNVQRLLTFSTLLAFSGRQIGNIFLIFLSK